MLSRRVAHELKVVRRVLVVARNVERHHALEKDFGGGVEGEEGIAVDVEEFAGRRVGAALQRLLGRNRKSRIEAEELVEPLLVRVAGAVSNRSGEIDLLERSCDSSCEWSRSSGGLRRRSFRRLRNRDGRSGPRYLAELLEELEGEGTTGAFVAVDGRGHEDEVGAEEGADEGEGDGGGLVDDNQLGLSENVEVLRLDVLSRREYQLQLQHSKQSRNKAPESSGDADGRC